MGCRWLVSALILAVLASGCGPGKSGSTSGDEIVLKTPDGNQLSLMQTIRQPGTSATLVTFWSIGCPGCREELPYLAKLYERHHDTGFNVIAVNAMDSPEAVSAFLDQQKLPFTVVLNGEGPNDLLQKYEVIGYPTNLIFDSSGKLVERIEGWEEFTVLRALKKAGVGATSSAKGG